MAKSQAKNKPRNNDLFNQEEIQEWFDEEEEVEGTEDAPAETIEQKYAKSQLRVIREHKDFSLDYLQHALKKEKFLINVAPDFQRRQRWSNKKRSQLIESFLMNIPIPSIYLFEKNYNEYEVVDGRQRLDSVREYLDNGFALSGLTYWSELNRKRFNQLPLVIQKGLLRRSLAAVVLLAEALNTEDDDFDVRNVLFERLNTGGEKLNPQELRNALYPGLFNKMLLEIARSKPFVKIWGIPEYTLQEKKEIPLKLANNTLYKTMADCELVLRVFAIREAIVQDIRGSLRRLLDTCMKRHEKDDEIQIEYQKDLFNKNLVKLVEIFEGNTFLLPKSKRPSRPLYDALMVAMILKQQNDVLDSDENIRVKLQEKIQTNYDVLIGRGNTIEAIKDRVSLAKTILFV